MLKAAFIYLISVPIYIINLFIYLKKKVKFTKIFFRTLFYFYVVAVIGVTLFPLPIQRSVIEDGIEKHYEHNNFIPLASIIDIVSHNSFEVIFTQIGGNLLLGMPLGFLVPLVWEKRNSLLKTLAVGFCFSFAIEASQFLISSILGYTYRISDVDDILLNCIGCVLGYLCFRVALLLRHPGFS